MEAPEKLYVDTEDRLSDSILYGFTEKRKDDDIEYIRKDAFIEKMFNFLSEKYLIKTKEPLRWVPIRQVIEDFKKYKED